LILQVDDIVDSSVTTQINVTDFIDVSLAATYVDDHFEDLYVRFKSTTTTVALQGVYRQISAYNGTTGQFTTAAFPAIPQVADVYEVVQIATATATASLDCDGVNTMFEPLLRGVSFYGKTKNLDTFLRVQSNSQDESGRIRIHSATTVVGLDLPTGVTNSAQESNYGFVESGNEQDFTFGVGQFIIFVFDNDLTYKTVTVNIDYDSIVTAGVGASDFRAASLITYFTQQDFFVGCRVRFKFNTTTAALRNQIGTITAYDETNGQITVAAPLPAAPVIGDTFEIIPTTTRNVVDLFNHRTFTNLGVYCDIEASYDGTKVQLTTKTEGTLGAVRCAGGNANDFSIPLLTDGTLLGASTVDSIEGLSVGLQLVINDSGVVGPADITITNIAGAASPYTVSVSVDAGGTDISGYLTGNSAYFMPRNQFDFTLIPAEGIDGYKNYVGLVQECQWIIDGKDTDFENYPGIKAAGVQIEIKAPVMHYVEVTIDVSTSDGLTLALVKNDVKSAISNYINGLGVGEDVVLSEIIAAVMAVTGIVDSSILTPTANVLIAANELARISETDIIVG